MARPSFFRRTPKLSPPAPAAPVLAIGDVHGRRDLLEQLLGETAGLPGQRVALGDYVDRGPDAPGVLARLRAEPGIVALMGNHEAMLVDFLDAPEVCGPLWLANGGGATLAAFGIDPAATQRAGRALSAALGETEGWLRGLPRLWRSGGLVAVHAALDPARPPERQDAQALVWGHPDFFRRRRADGLWVVHGHTIVEAPSVEEGRIAVDTGAVFTGRLTAALIEPDGTVTFTATDAHA